MKIFQHQLFEINLSHRFAAVLFALTALVAVRSGFCSAIDDAARTGDLAKVQALVQANPSVVSSTDEKYGQTPLHIAAFNDHKDVAEFLLAHNADVNAKAKNGSTPLHLAAAKGNKDIVELLLAHKAEIDALDNEGWSPVHSATYWKQKEMADFLISKGGKELPAPPLPPAAQPKAPPKVTGTEGDFTAYDDATVLDTKTKLMWMSRDNGNAVSWPDAKKFAANSKDAGYSDWRLPTPDEIAVLYDKSKSRKTYCASAVDELGAAADDIHTLDSFHLTCTRVWTSQERTDKPETATVFDFHTGKETTRPGNKDFVDTSCRVLEVRDVKESDVKEAKDVKDAK
ncbi:MAG: ankyrin repeat domain-containing protein [Terracidiphilus sp.]|jgi:hypothetical protein